MKRLYRKIYLTIIGSLLLVVLVAGSVWHLGAQQPTVGAALDLAGDIVLAALPPAAAPATAQQQALDTLAARLDTDIALYDSARQLVASTGMDLPLPRWHDDGGWSHGAHGPAYAFALDDGRWLVVDLGADKRNPVIGLILFLGVIALVVGVSAYPVARGLTRRLERLKAGVETLGAGDLAARVRVEGRDEVAHLAESFNQAAARIETLVAANRMMLANASHELRTPLARIRLGLDLLDKRPDPKLKRELQSDIVELDRLIDEILLFSRLEASPALGPVEAVDLQALCAEECARFDDCDFTGDSVIVTADPLLLRRLIRNLLENAERHGRPPIAVTLHKEADRAAIRVLDTGEGIPEAEREKVFTPFHRLGGDRPGAGLGLSLVRQIARLHGGDVAVWSDPSLRISGFRVDLPASG
ncbi:MAG: HAMP domain-containing sensor histidine kinase [Bauldia litoralis]|uniref:sensor histidine kinase n=3 Tax=Bauldia litoralis TaxID=665467 RepID=UPI0032984F97